MVTPNAPDKLDGLAKRAYLVSLLLIEAHLGEFPHSSLSKYEHGSGIYYTHINA